MFGHIGSEEIPLNTPEPRGLRFLIRVFVDADHAADTITRLDDHMQVGYVLPYYLHQLSDPFQLL